MAFQDIAANFHPNGKEPPVRPSMQHDLVSQTPQQLANFESGESRIVGFFSNIKKKFAKKELFGSAFVILYVFNQINIFRMGMKNNEMTSEGELQSSPDLGRMLNAAINMVISGWTFFSNRSAMAPEGNNFLQRGKYALANAGKCQVQVRDVLALAGGTTSMIEHFLKGFKVFQQLENRKLVKAGGQAKDVDFDRTRIAQGILSAIGNGLTVYALLGPEAARKKHKEQAKLEEDAHKLANFELRPFKEASSLPLTGRIKQNIKTIARFIKDNPMLMLNSAVSLSIAVALNIEGRSKQKAQAAIFGSVKDFADKQKVPSAGKSAKPVEASEQLFNSLFGDKKYNKKINDLAEQHGIKPEKGTSANFLAAFRGKEDAMKDLNRLIPDGRKALGEAGRRAISSSIMGVILNMWGLTFRAQQVLREDKIALGAVR